MHGLTPDRPEPVRRGGVEGDRRAGAELVLVEADPDSERPARDVAVLAAPVRDERVLRAGLGADRIGDVEELDVGIAVPSTRDARASCRDLELLPDGGVRWRRAGTIDLGGIAKGYAVDRAYDYCLRAGIRDFLIDFSGNVRAAVNFVIGFLVVAVVFGFLSVTAPDPLQLRPHF